VFNSRVLPDLQGFFFKASNLNDYFFDVHQVTSYEYPEYNYKIIIRPFQFCRIKYFLGVFKDFSERVGLSFQFYYIFLFIHYPMMSAYAYAGNNLINLTDVLGKGPADPVIEKLNNIVQAIDADLTKMWNNSFPEGNNSKVEEGSSNCQ